MAEVMQNDGWVCRVVYRWSSRAEWRWGGHAGHVVRAQG
jgi:hypothetical protein